MGLEYKSENEKTNLIVAVIVVAVVAVIVLARYYFSRESLELTPLEPRPFRCPYADNEECHCKFRRGYGCNCPFRNT
jgi:hypothetical protein